jgi:hypothetical protein
MTDPQAIKAAVEAAKGIDVGQLLSWITTAAVTGYLTWQKVRERRITKRLRIAANPERCRDHELRLRGIEKDIGEIKGDIKAIKVKIELE